MHCRHFDAVNLASVHSFITIALDVHRLAYVLSEAITAPALGVVRHSIRRTLVWILEDQRLLHIWPK